MKRENIYKRRLDKHMDELKWLYMELYNSQDMFDGLLEGMEGFYVERTERLRTLDASREEDPCWYRKSSMLGMMMYACLLYTSQSDSQICGLWKTGGCDGFI